MRHCENCDTQLIFARSQKAIQQGQLALQRQSYILQAQLDMLASATHYVEFASILHSLIGLTELDSLCFDCPLKNTINRVKQDTTLH